MKKFFCSCIIVLILTALAKLYSATGHAGVLDLSDPLFGISNRSVFYLAGGLELMVAGLLLLNVDIINKCVAVCWLTLVFVLYRADVFASAREVVSLLGQSHGRHSYSAANRRHDHENCFSLSVLRQLRHIVLALAAAQAVGIWQFGDESWQLAIGFSLYELAFQRLGLRRHVAAFNDATCRVVPKRGRVRALQNVNENCNRHLAAGSCGCLSVWICPKCPQRHFSRVSNGFASRAMDAAGLPCRLVRHFYFPDV